MKYQEYGDEFLFDDFPTILFLTHLNTQLKLPKIIPKIYTTQILAKQFITYLNCKGFVEIYETHFIILTPFQPYKLRCNDGSILKVLICESNDISHQLMVLFYKVFFISERKVTHLYGGICTDIRTIILNEKFSEWIEHGVNKLYLNIKRNTNSCNPRSLNDALDEIENIIRNDENITICIPTFGYEMFISKLSERFRKRIVIEGPLLILYKNLDNMKYFIKSSVCNSKIVLTNQELTMQHLINDLGNKKIIKIVENVQIFDKSINNSGYYEIQWSPFPTPFHLKLLTGVTRPTKIIAISQSCEVDIQIPNYLYKLCSIKRHNISLKINWEKKRELAEKRTLPITYMSANNTINRSKKKSSIYHIRKLNLCYLEDGDSDNN
ncbi:uncharacterized protein LOC119667908 isoform X3 [Teleopsis dalmanni]|uniref:uncharacterized protein LOC119667908 isoform X3 n=1 Tax=Teleopsis dalmanni TaxID=139649 RepID=UPI0018CE7F5C|nr:uncharacterized protein LOC119667908 isoform X3 [Teleopsis dalmanni]